MKSDAELRNEVTAELAWDPVLDAAAIDVTVHAGVVTLAGRVGTCAEKAAAAQAVARVAGTRAVAMELAVQPPPQHRRSDTEIAAAVWDTLSNQALVPVEKLGVLVERGWVTLSGEVDWDYERRCAEQALQALPGVVGISDRIALRQRPVPADLAQRIQGALERQAGHAARRIRIELRGDEVTLQGEVDSCAERAAAQGAVWCAPGVGRVLNELRVRGERGG
jgi:osmotically-inducible protein OsmY